MTEIYIHAKYAIIGDKCSKLIKDAGIIIEGNKIVRVGKHKDLLKDLAGHDVLKRPKHIVIPPLINAHTHLPETLLRGICDNKKLDVWLNKYIWPFESNLTREYAYYGALLGTLELIENGIGGFIDQYFYVEQIEKAVKVSGLRALLCPSIFDGTPETGTIENTWKHIKNIILSHVKKEGSQHSLVKFGLGPHAPYSVPKDYLLEINDLATKFSLPIHIHLNETLNEIVEFQKSYGMSPIEYVDHVGLTRNKILAAHCVHTSRRERVIMKKKDITVLHCPQSNLKLASGIAPVFYYIADGINVALGTDGNGSNNDLAILEELNTMVLLQKYLANDPTVISNAQALYIASIAGMKALGLNYNGLNNDALADLTIISLNAAHWWPQINLLSNIIFSSSSSDVTDLIVNGQILYLNKEHQTLDKESIIEKATKATNILMESVPSRKQF